MLIPMPKLARAEQKPDAYPEPDPLDMDLRRHAWALANDGKHAEAAEVWCAILAAHYDDADAADELGQVLGQLEKHDDAVNAFQRSLQFRPESAATKLNLGRTLLKLNRHVDARYNFEDILAKNPGDVDALLGLSAALRGLELNDASLHPAARAFDLKPEYAESAFGKAESLKALKQNEEAIELFRKALELQPDHRDAGISLGKILHAEKRSKEAATVLRTVVELHPDHLGGWLELGVALLATRDHAEATEAYRRALAIEPASATALCNLSLGLSGIGRFEEAIAACKRALAIEPGSPTAQFNLAFIYLTLGRFDEGWQAYELRFTGKNKAIREDIRAAPWCGEDLNGKSILVMGEQGNGDYLQFIRYLKPLADVGASVHFVAPKRLIRVLSTLPAPVTYVSELPAGSRYDFQCHLMSLPGRFHQMGWPIPAAPYLGAEPERVERWARRIGPDGFRIGIAWQGAVYQGRQSERAFKLENLLPLARIPGVRLISLQIGKGTEQIEVMPKGMVIETLAADFDTGEDGFIDAAAAMANLDLIVSCDTSLVHLAGALGKSVWIALNEAPEWRWQRNRSDTVWYSNARLFRQTTRGDWDGVFHRMAEALQEPARSLAAPVQTANGVAHPAPYVPISWGECVDKITILEIKLRNAASTQAAANVARELGVLTAALARMGPATPELDRKRAVLRQVNEELWAIEDEIRDCEAKQQFGERFIELARSVYRQNDERARIKRAINELTNSSIVEEKLYKTYEGAESEVAGVSGRNLVNARTG